MKAVQERISTYDQHSARSLSCSYASLHTRCGRILNEMFASLARPGLLPGASSAMRTFASNTVLPDSKYLQTPEKEG